MSECSAAKLAANRLNALKSTGPTTQEGKDRSRGNALKHGLCSLVVDIPGDDPEVLAVRFGEWDDEMNPAKRAAQSYLILQAVRRSGRLDRLDAAYHARVAGLARDAHKSRKEDKMREVDGLGEMLLVGHCNVAVRRLMLTSEGCAYLINEWNLMRPGLEPPPHWDGADQVRVLRLMGHETAINNKCPGPLALATKAITEHRAMAWKLKRNENPDILMWHERYKNEKEHQDDREQVEFLADKSEKYRLWLLKQLDDYVAMLSGLKAAHDASDAREEAEIPYRSLFDASDAGKLLHRYEMDTERSLLRCFKEVRELNRADGLSTQTVDKREITTIVPPHPPARREPPPARNEPTARPSGDLFEGVGTVPGASYAYVPVNITPARGPKNQR